MRSDAHELAAALIEIAQMAGLSIRLDEAAIPIRLDGQRACEMLGLDPLYVANKGCSVAFVPEAEAERTLSLPWEIPVSADACLIGQVTTDAPARRVMVTLPTTIGTTRVLDLLIGEQLPRIC